MSPRHIKTPTYTKKTQWKIGKTVIQALGKLRQEDLKWGYSTGYILSSRPDSAAQQGPILKQAKIKRKLQFYVLASQLWWRCLCTMPLAGSVQRSASCTRGQVTWARLLCSVTLPVSTPYLHDHTHHSLHQATLYILWEMHIYLNHIELLKIQYQ